LFGRKGKQLAFTVTKQPGSTSHGSDLVASFTEKLKAIDYQVARRKLADFKRDLERTDARLSNTSLNEVLNKYDRAIGALSPKTQRDRLSIIRKLRREWYGADFLPLRTIKLTDAEVWLSRHYKNGFRHPWRSTAWEIHPIMKSR
jgi:hypothetical protein